MPCCCAGPHNLPLPFANLAQSPPVLFSEKSPSVWARVSTEVQRTQIRQIPVASVRPTLEIVLANSYFRKLP